MQTAVSRAEERGNILYPNLLLARPSRAQQSLVPGSTTPSFMGAGAGAAAVAVVARWLVSEVEFLNFNIDTFGKLLLWFSFR